MYRTWFLSHSLRATAGLALTGALLTACSKENNIQQTSNNYEGLQTAIINADGGKLEGDKGLTVEVPPGAVSQTITIAGGPVDAVKAPPLPAEVTKLGLVFTLQPHGQAFAKPATITIPFETTGPSMKLYTAQPQGTWSAVTGAAPQGTGLRAQVDHFSFYVVVSEDPCIQGGKSAPDGTACGTDKVCKAGVCQGCKAGGACALGDGECKVGTLSCATGEPRCVPSATNQPDGTACGTDKVCSAGVCKACAEGKACTVAEFPCKQAALACGSGQPVCEALADDRPNGESCGNGQTCFNGACIACSPGAACEGANPCQQAAIACGSGQPICEETGKNTPDGTACGAGQVCLQGACQACAEGTACSLPESPCKQAALSCSTGKAVCKATTQDVADGTACGASKVCGKGVCTACEQDKACTPTDACHVGKTQCGSGAAVCEDTGALAPAGTACGTGQACDETGACIKVDGVLSVTAGDKGSALINQTVATPLIVKLTGTGGTPVGNKTVKVTAPPGASVEPPEATTSSQGKATFVLRVGRQVGPYEYTVTSSGATPLKVSATATAPAPGTLIPIVNGSQSSGDYTKTTVAINATANGLVAMAVASDGTLYVTATNKQIFRVTKEGAWEHVAGDLTVTDPPGGDGGPAKSAIFNNINDIAIDDASGILYVADYQPSGLLRLRAIDLNLGTIDSLGGDGTQGSPGYGDGGPLSLGQLVGVASMNVGPGGVLYIVDGSSRIRAYDPNTTLISSWAGAETASSQMNTLCEMAGSTPPVFDAAGQAFFSTRLATPGYPCQFSALGIIRREPTNPLALTLTVDGSGSNAMEGYSKNTFLKASVGLALDQGGNVLGASAYGAFRIDGATWRLDRLMGDFVNSGVDGNYGPAKAAKANIRRVGLDAAGNLYTAEGTSVRTIWQAGAAAPTPVTIVQAAGDKQSATITTGVATPLKVKVTTGADNKATANVPLRWSAGTSGAIVAASGQTDVQGEASAPVVLGTGPGSYGVEASMEDIHGASVGNKISFTLTATAPQAGDVFPAFGSGSVADNLTPGPALASPTYYGPKGPALASDGSFYVASRGQVVHVSPTGFASLIAGKKDPTGSTGDNGPALQAEFTSAGPLALDEANQRLYVGDAAAVGPMVRMVDLKTGIVSRLAGGGSAPGPGYGDNGPGTSATLSGFYALTVGPDGAVYMTSHQRVRRIDPNTGIITTWFNPTDVNTASLKLCVVYEGPVFDAQGDAYMVVQGGGTSIPSTSGCGTGVLLKRSTQGAFQVLIGNAAGTFADGPAAESAYSGADIYFVAMPNGDVYYRREATLRKWTKATNTISTVMGTLGVAGKTGLLGPAKDALLGGPGEVFVSAQGHLLLNDPANYRIVGIW